MAKRCHCVRVDGKTLRLRLTLEGQRRLKQRYGDDELLQTLGEAAADGEKMAAVLDAALSWEGSGNCITSGEELYDLMVDDGWCGQVRFGELAVEIAVASGLVDERQAKALKASLVQSVEEIFQGLEKA